MVLYGHDDDIATLAFSPDGRWLATGSNENTAHLWDMNNPTADSIVLRGHEGSVQTLAFSSDGRWLATGSSDGTARLWDRNNLTAAPIVLRGHDDSIIALAFSPDGRRLATGSWDATARLWTLDINEVAGFACKFVGRNFTRAEWTQYFLNEPYHPTCQQWPVQPEASPTPQVEN